MGSPPLRATKKNLKGPSNNSLAVKGWFRGTLDKRPELCGVEQEIYVVSQLSRCLLGQPAIEALNLIMRVGEVHNTLDSEGVGREFPQLFEGLGKLEGEYTIQLEEGVKPIALTTPRRVAIPLMKAVEKELQRMEKMGVIAPVTQPTDWCAGMVVVPKKNEVRICVDLTGILADTTCS